MKSAYYVVASSYDTIQPVFEDVAGARLEVTPWTTESYP